MSKIRTLEQTQRTIEDAIREEEKFSTNETTEETAFQPQEKEKFDKGRTDIQRGAAILFCLDIEQAFKMYSYRIIDHTAFLERVKELTEELKTVL